MKIFRRILSLLIVHGIGGIKKSVLLILHDTNSYNETAKF